LRVPSEVLTLTWDHVDWDRRRLTVPSPKTARYEGREVRVIPLFPELVEPLNAVWDEAKEGCPWIITRYRDSAVNLRTELQRIIARAGLEAWPKLWQNLRRTRETELAAHFPMHVVCNWTGNTTAVAMRHYLRVVDADFEKALTRPTGALQNPV